MLVRFCVLSEDARSGRGGRGYFNLQTFAPFYSWLWLVPCYLPSIPVLWVRPKANANNKQSEKQMSETKYEAAERAMAEHDIPCLSRTNMDMADNHRVIVENNAAEFFKKWETGGQGIADIVMCQFTGLVHLAVKLIKATGMDQETAKLMMEATVDAVYCKNMDQVNDILKSARKKRSMQ